MYVVNKTFVVEMCRQSFAYFTCISDNDVIENGTKCFDESGKSVGKFVTRNGDLGLAILKLSDM